MANRPALKKCHARAALHISARLNIDANRDQVSITRVLRRALGKDTKPARHKDEPCALPHIGEVSAWRWRKFGRGCFLTLTPTWWARP